MIGHLLLCWCAGFVLGATVAVIRRRRDRYHERQVRLIGELRLALDVASRKLARCRCGPATTPFREPSPPKHGEPTIDFDLRAGGGRVYAPREARPQPYERPAPTSVPGPGKSRLD